MNVATAERNRAASVEARLDRIPASPYLWRLVVLLALGGFFETYELFMTAFVSPGLVRNGIFHVGKGGMFGLPDQATFASLTFFGLFLGTIGLGWIADRLGRRRAFRISALGYGVATIAMAMQNNAKAIFLIRLLGSIAIGAQLITLDVYASEIVPRNIRGRAFALAFAVVQSAIPILALLAWLVVPRAPLQVQGWRWVMLIGGAGSFLVWWLSRFLPESPRWLARHGRLDESEQIASSFEQHAVKHLGRPLGAPVALPTDEHGKPAFSELFRPPYRSRTIMLSAFSFFQAVGFYGFGNWLPALVGAQVHKASRGGLLSFVITLAFPLGPLLWSTIAERYERKWQIVGAAVGTAIFGMLFATHASSMGLALLGILITLANTLLAYSSHAYQSELFPTRIRGQGVGFVYSWGRLSTALSSFAIGFLFQRSGAKGVFAFISFAMAIMILSVGVFGPKTRGRSLEEISG